MIPQKNEREVFQDDKRYIDTGRIERAAVHAVSLYIDSCPKLYSTIFTNDLLPIWDGDIYLYRNEHHAIDNFVARVPVQIKGRTNTKDNFYRIERKYLEGFKNDRGCIFFLVQEDEYYNPSKILYAILSSAELDTLLKKETRTIKIELNEVPANPNDFEKEIFEFARKRNEEKIENPAPKEIQSLVEEFEKVEEHLNEIEEDSTRNDLDSLLNIIKSIEDDGSVTWRDKFIYCSQKALKLVINNIKDYDSNKLQLEIGYYLLNQELYHMVNNIVKSLKSFSERIRISPSLYIGDMEQAQRNFAILQKAFNSSKDAEKE